MPIWKAEEEEILELSLDKVYDTPAILQEVDHFRRNLYLLLRERGIIPVKGKMASIMVDAIDVYSENLYYKTKL